MFINCSECGKAVATSDIKYHTPPIDGKVHNVFCNAYCSHDWYIKNKNLGKDNDTK